jgi:signal transduction histidine kinase
MASVTNKQTLSNQMHGLPQTTNSEPANDGWENPGEEQLDLTLQSLSTPFLNRAFEFLLPALLAQNEWDSSDVLLSAAEGKLVRVFSYGEPIPVTSEGKLLPNSTLVLALKQRSILLEGNSALNSELGCGLWLGMRASGQIYGALALGRKKARIISETERERTQKLADWLGTLIAHERERGKSELESLRGERERIGMDLHDGIIQSLYGIGLSLQNARIQSAGNTTLQEQIVRALNGLDKAIGDIRNYILNLRPRELNENNLLEGMRSLTREFRANTFIEVDLEGNESEAQRLPQAHAEALFHIYQEALSNVSKHANATRISVKVWRTAGRMMLRVNDDGIGFDPAQTSKQLGHGVANMQTRAEAVGGGIELISIRRQGTTLRAWVPFKSAETKSE